MIETRKRTVLEMSLAHELLALADRRLEGEGRAGASTGLSHYGLRKFHLDLALFGSNFESVGVLAAAAVSTSGSFVPGTRLGMRR